MAQPDGEDATHRAYGEAIAPVKSASTRLAVSVRLGVRDGDRRMPLNDSWIAATAIANRIPVVSQDDDYDGVPDLGVIRV